MAALLRQCETLWSAREIASMTLSAEQARHTENVFHIRQLFDLFSTKFDQEDS